MIHSQINHGVSKRKMGRGKTKRYSINYNLIYGKKKMNKQLIPTNTKRDDCVQTPIELAKQIVVFEKELYWKYYFNQTKHRGRHSSHKP